MLNHKELAEILNDSDVIVDFKGLSLTRQKSRDLLFAESKSKSNLNIVQIRNAMWPNEMPHGPIYLKKLHLNYENYLWAKDNLKSGQNILISMPEYSRLLEYYSPPCVSCGHPNSHRELLGRINSTFTLFIETSNWDETSRWVEENLLYFNGDRWSDYSIHTYTTKEKISGVVVYNGTNDERLNRFYNKEEFNNLIKRLKVMNKIDNNFRVFLSFHQQMGKRSIEIRREIADLLHIFDAMS